MVKFKIIPSITDPSTFKLCCTRERGNLPHSSDVFVQGIIKLTAFLLQKVCTVKRGRARPYKDNCFQLINSNLQYIHFNLTQEDTVTWSHSSLQRTRYNPQTSTLKFLQNQCIKNWRCISEGRIWPTAVSQKCCLLKIQNLPKCHMRLILPNTRHAFVSLGRHLAGV